MVEVRYYSKSGRTKKIAEAIAEGAGTTAVSITEVQQMPQGADVLFLGGAPYANVMAAELRQYAQKLGPENAKKVVLFTTSNWSKRTLKGLQDILKSNGVKVSEETFYANAFHIDARIEDARNFGNTYSSEIHLSTD